MDPFSQVHKRVVKKDSGGKWEKQKVGSAASYKLAHMCVHVPLRVTSERRAGFCITGFRPGLVPLSHVSVQGFTSAYLQLAPAPHGIPNRRWRKLT
jgi:hypothetical protein